jgi:hypothetical protein
MADTNLLAPASDAGEALPVVAYLNSFGNALCKGVPRFSTDIALTPHAPAHAALSALRADNERLTRELPLACQEREELRKLCCQAQELGRGLTRELEVSRGVGKNLFDSAQELLQENIALRASLPDAEKVMAIAQEWVNCERDQVYGLDSNEKCDAAREALRSYITKDRT